jgi:hypothetical protein
MQKILSTLALTLFAACAHSPNLLKNPSFDHNLKDWSFAGFPRADAWSASGPDKRRGIVEVVEKMRSIHPPGQTADATAAWQCVAVDPRKSYDVGAEFFIPANQSQRGTARVGILWWKTDRCGDVGMGTPSFDAMFAISSGTEAASVSSSWQALRACDIRPPEGAVAAEFSLEVANLTMTPGATFRALFDNAYMVPHEGTCLSTPAN